MPYLNILSLGHGGGVPMANNGNTNFAVFVTEDQMFTPSPVWPLDLLAEHPYWLIDCGPDTLHTLSTAEVAPSPFIQNLQGVFLTHCHGDHSGGLAALAWRTKFVEQMKVKLVVHRDCEEILRNQLCELEYDRKDLQKPGERLRIEDFFDVTWVEKDPPYSLFELGGEKLAATFFDVDHNIRDFPSFGIELEHLRTGQIAVFSGDTSRPIERSWVGVEIMFHDCQFYSDAPLSEQVHCPFYALLDAVPQEHRNKVVLVHTNGKPPETDETAQFAWMDIETCAYFKFDVVKDDGQEDVVECDCGGEGFLDLCPFAAEGIHEDTGPCTCCDDCRSRCAEEV